MASVQIITCPQCKKDFEKRWHRQRYCSPECSTASRRRFEVTAEELDRLVWEMPTVKVAELFGVSDKAIEKRCDALCVAKPPRGYWAQQKALEAFEE